MRSGSGMGRSRSGASTTIGKSPASRPGVIGSRRLRLQPRRPLSGDHPSSRLCLDRLGRRPARGRLERPGPGRRGQRPDSARTAGGSPWRMRMGSSSSTTWRPVSPAGRWRGPASQTTWRSVRTGPRSPSSIGTRTSPACRIIEVETGRLVRSIPFRPARSDRSPGVPTAPRWRRRAGIPGSISGMPPPASRGRRSKAHTNGGLQAAFHPAGTLLASNGWEGRLRIWDTVLGRPVLSLTGWTDS